MRIEIKQKFAPFSHLPGTRCLIPGTTWEVMAYPAKLFFWDLATGERRELALPLEGPIKGFTVIQNLEKAYVTVSGTAKGKFFSYRIEKDRLVWKTGESIRLSFLKAIELPPTLLRLSLGSHKAQNWDQVKERLDLQEILPMWLKLASVIPQGSPPQKLWGTYQLLGSEWTKKNARVHFENLFQAAFQGILSPRVQDENYLGLVREEKVPADVSPIPLIHEGAKQILSLFFAEEGSELALLPALPPELHAGRLMGCHSKNGVLLDLEWSKKELKKVVLHPQEDGEITLALPKGVSSFRVRKVLRQKGSVVSAKESLCLKKGQRLYLDRFI